MAAVGWACLCHLAPGWRQVVSHLLLCGPGNRLMVSVVGVAAPETLATPTAPWEDVLVPQSTWCEGARHPLLARALGSEHGWIQQQRSGPATQQARLLPSLRPEAGLCRVPASRKKMSPHLVSAQLGQPTPIRAGWAEAVNLPERRDGGAG